MLATTQRIREEGGADYAKDEHLAAELEELGPEADPCDLPEAESGVGGLK